MATIFSKIISGQILSYKIAENEKFYAFLDINPIAKGHVLVVPKNETDYFFDLEDQIIAEIMIFCKQIAGAMKKVIECKRIGVAVVGLEVPHAHIHLVPLRNMEDINFSKPKLTFTPEEFSKIAESISMKLA